MLGIIKNLFKKTQETVKEEDIDTWLDHKVSTLKKRLMEQLRLTNGRIKTSIEETKQKLEALEEAGLLNPDVPERAKHFMRGNKDEYTRRINNFLQSISEPTEIEQFEDFKTKVQASLHMPRKCAPFAAQIPMRTPCLNSISCCVGSPLRCARIAGRRSISPRMRW